MSKSYLPVLADLPIIEFDHDLWEILDFHVPRMVVAVNPA